MAPKSRNAKASGKARSEAGYLVQGAVGECAVCNGVYKPHGSHSTYQNVNGAILHQSEGQWKISAASEINDYVYAAKCALPSRSGWRDMHGSLVEVHVEALSNEEIEIGDAMDAARDAGLRRVSFDLGAVERKAVQQPYSVVYGQHPREFVFGRNGEMLPDEEAESDSDEMDDGDAAPAKETERESRTAKHRKLVSRIAELAASAKGGCMSVDQLNVNANCKRVLKPLSNDANVKAINAKWLSQFPDIIQLQRKGEQCFVYPSQA